MGDNGSSLLKGAYYFQKSCDSMQFLNAKLEFFLGLFVNLFHCFVLFL